MPQLEVQVRTEESEEVVAGELAITVTFINTSNERARFDVHQAAHPALVLESGTKTIGGCFAAALCAGAARSRRRNDRSGRNRHDRLLRVPRPESRPGTYRVRYVGEFPALAGRGRIPCSATG